MNVDWPRFAEIVAAHQKFVLTSHIRPDCDALGSELGMAGVLKSLGKDVRIVNGHETPPNLAFIDPHKQIHVIGESITADQLSDAEVLIVLDTSAWVQLGGMADVVRDTPAKKLIVDHHVSEDDMGAELFKDVTAEATGRLVVEAADQLGVALTPEIAKPVFAALTTDTGWLRFASVTSRSFELAARLVAAGAVPHEIFGQLYEQDTLGRVRLRGYVLARVETELDGRLSHTYILRHDFQHTGALPSDTEDLVNLALSIRGTEVAVIMIEQLDGGFKVSFRSRSSVDCSQLASSFGGGGHKAAAGAFVEGEMADVQVKVLDAVRAAMR